MTGKEDTKESRSTEPVALMESWRRDTEIQAGSFKEGNIYGDHVEDMILVMKGVLSRIDTLRKDMKKRLGTDPVDHCLARIKSDRSMREKCRRKGLPEDSNSALHLIHDAIGIRIICGFLNDVYVIRDYLARFEDYEVIDEKDYIRHAKSNGYRSYHMILRVSGSYYVELQLRTISMDTWAALEHQIHYKKGRFENDRLIVSELKRWADELASTDVSMQTLKDMIDSVK